MTNRLEEQAIARKELEAEVYAENLVGIDWVALIAGIAAFVHFVLE